MKLTCRVGGVLRYGEDRRVEQASRSLLLPRLWLLLRRLRPLNLVLQAPPAREKVHKACGKTACSVLSLSYAPRLLY